MTRTLTQALAPASPATPQAHPRRAGAQQSGAFDAACAAANAPRAAGTTDDPSRTGRQADAAPTSYPQRSQAATPAGAASPRAQTAAQPGTTDATAARVSGAARDVAPAANRSSLDTMLARAAPGGTGADGAGAHPRSPARSQPGQGAARPAPDRALRGKAQPSQEQPSQDLSARALTLTLAQAAHGQSAAMGQDAQALPAVGTGLPDAQQRPEHKHRHPAGEALAPQPMTLPDSEQPATPVLTQPPLRTRDREAGAIAAAGAQPALQPGTLGLASGPVAASSAQSAPETQPQLLQSALSLATDGGGSARVTLHPNSLGTVVVQVSVTAQGVTHIHLSAQTAEGYRALAAGTGHLAQQLAQGGLSVGVVQAALAQPAPQPGAQSGAQPAQSGFADAGGAGGLAGGFAGGAPQQQGGGDQHRPPAQDFARDAALAPTPDPRDETVKAYA